MYQDISNASYINLAHQPSVSNYLIRDLSKENTWRIRQVSPVWIRESIMPLETFISIRG